MKNYYKGVVKVKKLLMGFVCIALVLILAVGSASAVQSDEFTEYGQAKIQISEAKSTPFADGVIEEDEYGQPIKVLTYDPNDKSQYWNGLEESDSFKLEDVLPEKAVLYMSYDQSFLYVAAVVTDENHYSPNEGEAAWDGDYLEFDLSFNFDGTVDGMLDRHRIAYCLTDSGNQVAYSATIPTYVDGNPIVNGTKIIKRDETNSTTTYEMALKWSDINADGWEYPAEKGYFMYQFGVAHPNYAQLSDYKAYLGCWRYAIRIPEGVVGDSAELGLHIFELKEENSTASQQSSTVSTVSGNTNSSLDTEKDIEDINVYIIIGVSGVVVIAVAVAIVVLLKKKKR